MVKQSSKGQQVEIKVGQYLNSLSVTITVDGKRVVGGYPNIVDLTPAVNGCSKAVQVSNVKVALTDTETTTLQAEIDAAQAEIDADPAAQLSKLLSDRQRLALEIKLASEAQSRIMRQAVHTSRYDQQGADEAKTRQTEAQQALAEFDAAHPEVVAEIDRLRYESVERGIQA